MTIIKWVSFGQFSKAWDAWVGDTHIQYQLLWSPPVWVAIRKVFGAARPETHLGSSTSLAAAEKLAETDYDEIQGKGF